MKRFIPLFLLTIILFGSPQQYQIDIAKKFSKNYNEDIRIEVVPENVEICSWQKAYGCTYTYASGTRAIVIRDVVSQRFYFKHAMFHEIAHYFGEYNEGKAENYAIQMDGHDYGIYKTERALLIN